jgi:hypothetical protein
MSRPFRHDIDHDIIDGVYVDQEGGTIGAIILPEERRRERPDTFLVVARPGVVAVHAEGALEADHRTVSYERLAALSYEPDVTPPDGVTREGVRWDAGDAVVFTFETEDEALLAQ